MDTKPNYEIWKPFYGFEGFYEVSNQGRVRSVDHYISEKIDVMGRHIPPILKRGKLLKQRKHPFGYKLVTLSKNNEIFHRVIHRLVAEAFLGPRPSEETVIRHLNGNPTDNRLENLAYGTQKDNMMDAIKQDTVEYGERRYNAKLDNATVIEIKKEIICGYGSGEISKKYGVPQSQIWKIGMVLAWKRVGFEITQTKKCKFLTDEEKQEVVRLRHDEHMPLKKIAKHFGVSVTQICNTIEKFKNEDLENRKG